MVFLEGFDNDSAEVMDLSSISRSSASGSGRSDSSSLGHGELSDDGGGAAMGLPLREMRDSFRLAWRGKEGVGGRRGLKMWSWGRPCEMSGLAHISCYG